MYKYQPKITRPVYWGTESTDRHRRSFRGGTCRHRIYRYRGFNNQLAKN